MNAISIQVGDIVALHTHQYFRQVTNILYSGEPAHQSSLMVVTQKLPQNMQSESEGPVLFHFKCYWYSPFAHNFDFAWISEAMLKLIEHRTNFLNPVLASGTQMVFATTQLELSKRKSTLSIDLGHAERESLHITALPSFVPPVLMCNGSPRKRKDAKSSKKEKEEQLDDDLVKVKWFNSKLNKISEAIVPRICLDLVDHTDPEILRQIYHAIDKKQFIKTKIEGVLTFIQPVLISYLSGYFFLRGIDFLSNRIWNHIDVRTLDVLDFLKSPVTKRAPRFDYSQSRMPIESSEDLITQASIAGKTVRLKYTDQYMKESVRCIRDIVVLGIKDNSKQYMYVRAFCLLRNDYRNFEVERINWVELIDI